MATNYIWDFATDRYLEEVLDDGTTISSYTTEPDRQGNMISQHKEDTSFFEFDGMGNTRQISNDAQAVVNEYNFGWFGDVIAKTETTRAPFQFKGYFGTYYDDMLGSYYLRGTCYSPVTARSLSKRFHFVASFLDEFPFENLPETPITIFEPPVIPPPDTIPVPFPWDFPVPVDIPQIPFPTIPGHPLVQCPQTSYHAVCKKWLLNDVGIINGTFPITVNDHKDPTQKRKCDIKISCRVRCKSGLPADTNKDGGIIEICISDRVTDIRSLALLYIHEVEHAKQYCSGWDLDDKKNVCGNCINYERQAHIVSCNRAFSTASERAKCVACGIYYSCMRKCNRTQNPEPKHGCHVWEELGVDLPGDFHPPDPAIDFPPRRGKKPR